MAVRLSTGLILLLVCLCYVCYMFRVFSANELGKIT